MTEFPFPLADGRLAHLTIPGDGRLERCDAERLAEYVLTLPTEPTLCDPSGVPNSQAKATE